MFRDVPGGRLVAPFKKRRGAVPPKAWLSALRIERGPHELTVALNCVPRLFVRRRFGEPEFVS